MKRRAPLSRRRLSVVRDIWGDKWTVAERRPTDYGFAVYMGWPYVPYGAQRGGRPAIVVTASLAAHVRKHVQRPHFLPLPVGRKALRRVRQQLGVDHRVWTDARLDWWIARIDDLARLSVVKFAAKHRMSPWTRQGTLSSTLVFKMRVALLG